MGLAHVLRHDIGPAVYDEAHRLRDTLSRFGVTTGGRQWATAAWLRHTRRTEATNVLDRDWDVLVVLDACRYDEFARVADDYEFVTDIDSIHSTGSATYEWGPTVFGADDGRDRDGLGYVTSNPYSHNFAAEDLAHLDEVWRYAWDAEWGSVPAQAVTDRAIHAGRTDAADRLIIHYMQPHTPFIGSESGHDSATAFRGGGDGTRWGAVQRGEVSRAVAIKGYRRTLRYVLDSVELLCENMDADRMVVTADHGELFGEWGLFGHMMGLPVDPLLQVPWARAAASDERTHDPSEYDRDGDGLSVDDRLAALGYR